MMLRLYDYPSSGNGYKVRLLLALLGTAYERVDLDIEKGETHTADFLARNPNGKIPVLELEDGTALPESNAILWYLAEGTFYLPEGRLERAQVLRWMFFEQYSHEPYVAPYVAVARFILMHPGMARGQAPLLREKQDRGYQALGVMEGHLAGRAFFVGESLSVADIALYAYTHVAEEGGFDLGRFPALTAWLARVARTPGYVPITAV